MLSYERQNNLNFQCERQSGTVRCARAIICQYKHYDIMFRITHWLLLNKKFCDWFEVTQWSKKPRVVKIRYYCEKVAKILRFANQLEYMQGAFRRGLKRGKNDSRHMLDTHTVKGLGVKNIER